MKVDLATSFEHRMQEKKLKTIEANSQLNDVVLQLSDELNNLKRSFNGKRDGESLLICQTPLDDFYAEEDKFQDAVTNFTRILFAESLSDFQPRSEASGELLRGTPADSEQHEALREECHRLDAASRLALEAELEAEVFRARQDAKRRQLKRLCSDPGLAPALLSEEEHRANLTRLHSLRSHVERLRQSELPALLHDRSCALAAQVELSQLRLQEFRNRFFIHRQEKLIRLLLKQQSWDALVVMLHETERRSHKLLLRTLQRLQEQHRQLMAKTVEIEFDPPTDAEQINFTHPSIAQALKTLGRNQLDPGPDTMASHQDELRFQRNSDYFEQIEEIQKNVSELRTRLMPEGAAAECQLSYPEVRQLMASTKAQVKSVSQKVQHFIKMAAVQSED